MNPHRYRIVRQRNHATTVLRWHVYLGDEYICGFDLRREAIDYIMFQEATR
jgi:hypothetical protein